MNLRKSIVLSHFSGGSAVARALAAEFQSQGSAGQDITRQSLSARFLASKSPSKEPSSANELSVDTKAPLSPSKNQPG